jgi:hypothetical protein
MAGISLHPLLESPLLEHDFDGVIPKESYMTARLQFLSDNSELDPYVRTSIFSPMSLHTNRVWSEKHATSTNIIGSQ